MGCLVGLIRMVHGFLHRESTGTGWKVTVIWVTSYNGGKENTWQELEQGISATFVYIGRIYGRSDSHQASSPPSPWIFFLFQFLFCFLLSEFCKCFSFLAFPFLFLFFIFIIFLFFILIFNFLFYFYLHSFFKSLFLFFVFLFYVFCFLFMPALSFRWTPPNILVKLFLYRDLDRDNQYPMANDWSGGLKSKDRGRRKIETVEWPMFPTTVIGLWKIIGLALKECTDHWSKRGEVIRFPGWVFS